jgi:hypothetical protein
MQKESGPASAAFSERKCRSDVIFAHRRSTKKGKKIPEISAFPK